VKVVHVAEGGGAQLVNAGYQGLKVIAVFNAGGLGRREVQRVKIAAEVDQPVTSQAEPVTGLPALVSLRVPPSLEISTSRGICATRCAS
jgi:hypothetical protein